MAIRLASSTACDQISSFQPLQDIEKVLVHTADAQNEKVGMLDVRLEGLTLRVASVKRSMEFYGSKLGLRVEIDKAPQFAMIRVGGPTGGTIGLLAHDSDNPLGSISMTPEQRAGIHVELTTDNLDFLYEHLKARG